MRNANGHALSAFRGKRRYLIVKLSKNGNKKDVPVHSRAARIMIKGKHKWLGRFDYEKQAANAYNEAVAKYFKEEF